MIEFKKKAVIEVYNGEGKYEGLLEDGPLKVWITTPEKAKAEVSLTDERYRDRYIVKEL